MILAAGSPAVCALCFPLTIPPSAPVFPSSKYHPVTTHPGRSLRHCHRLGGLPHMRHHDRGRCQVLGPQHLRPAGHRKHSVAGQLGGCTRCLKGHSCNMYKRRYLFNKSLVMRKIHKAQANPSKTLREVKRQAFVGICFTCCRETAGGARSSRGGSAATRAGSMCILDPLAMPPCPFCANTHLPYIDTVAPPSQGIQVQLHLHSTSGPQANGISESYLHVPPS